MVKYEYLIVDEGYRWTGNRLRNIQAVLNELGAGGWRVVAVTRIERPDEADCDTEYLMEREVKECDKESDNG